MFATVLPLLSLYRFLSLLQCTVCNALANPRCVLTVRCALDARERACRWSTKSSYALKDQFEKPFTALSRTEIPVHGPFTDLVEPFTAMDVALFSVYFPDLALEVLAYPTLVTERQGKLHVTLLEAAGLDVLLSAALRSPACDELLATDVFRTVLDSRMQVLWLIHWSELALLLCLGGTYTAWAFGADGFSIPALVLACYFGVVEAIQFFATLRPLFGDAALRQWPEHVLDPYNLVDVVMVGAVVLTVLGRTSVSSESGSHSDFVGEPLSTPMTAEATTVLLMLLKVVASLRAMESFGFLVDMLLSTAAVMVPFGTILTLSESTHPSIGPFRCSQ